MMTNGDIFIGVLGITLALYSMVFYFYFKIKEEPQHREVKEDKKKFYRAIKSALQLGTLESLDDIENIYKGIKRESLEGISYHKYLNIWLREFNLDLVSKNPTLLEDKEIGFTFDNLIKNKHIIEGFIKELDGKAPFAELQDAERNLLNDISLSMDRQKQENKLINPKLLELAGIIKSKDEEIKWQKMINKITIVTALIGLFLTIFFGLFSLKP